MPAIMKKKATTAGAANKSAASSQTAKAPKAKQLISKLGVTANVQTAAAKTKHAYNPVKSNRGIVFIKHIPHGFYEEQLKAYFEQFGAVTRTRVARSDRSGRSKGYAFVEFRVPEVAQIAAETMDNYLMFKQVLKTAYIPPDEQKYNYFRQTVHRVPKADGTEKLVTPHTIRTAKAVKKMNTMPTKKQYANRVERALYKLKKSQEKFAGNNNSIDLQHVVHNKPDPNAPQIHSARRPDPKALDAKVPAGPKAAAVSDPDSTLAKLLNETIGESDEDNGSSDEDYDGDASGIQVYDTTIDTSLDASTASSSSSSSLSGASPTPVKKQLKRTKTIAAASAPKAKRLASNDSTSSSSAAVSSPEPAKQKKQQVKPAKKQPEPEPTTKTTKKASALLAAGGVQKKRSAASNAKKPVSSLSQAVKNADVVKGLIRSTADSVKPVKANALKKKPKRS